MMSLKVFPQIGVQRTTYDAYHRLERSFANEVYPSKKAAGALGGAVNGARRSLTITDIMKGSGD